MPKIRLKVKWKGRKYVVVVVAVVAVKENLYGAIKLVTDTMCHGRTWEMLLVWLKKENEMG